jgi:hypothetical protein
VTADGFGPLPVHVREALPPGTLLRPEQADRAYLIVPEVIGRDAESPAE